MDADFPPGFRAQLDACGAADLVVGLPTFNHGGAIAEVVRSAQAGLAEAFPGVRAALVLADGGSTDGTPELAREASLGTCPLLLAPGPVLGQGAPARALRTVLAAALEVDARACAVLGADLRSLQPAWMDLLLSPILRDGLEFVAPRYLRRRYEGTINDFIVYPLTRSLYGLRLRHPLGGAFALSGRLVAHGLALGVPDLIRPGLETWVATTALAGSFRAGQASLGRRVQDDPDPPPALSDLLRQVVGTVFDLMEEHADVWNRIQGSAPIPSFGPDLPLSKEPVRVDTARMVRAFRRGVRDLGGVWGAFLAPETLRELGRVGVWDPSRFYVPPDLWVRVVHAFALAWRRRVMDRHHLLQALTPIYLGWVAAFVGETREGGTGAVEALEEKLCLCFEAHKPELCESWRTP